MAITAGANQFTFSQLSPYGGGGIEIPPPSASITITITEIPEWRNDETLTLTMYSEAWVRVASPTATVEEGTATFTANVAPGTYRISLQPADGGGGNIAWDQHPSTRIDAGVNTIRFNDGNLIR